MKKDAKNQFKAFLESIKNEDPALIEAFDKSFDALFEASATTKTYGTYKEQPVIIEITIDDVNAHYVPETRGYRDSYGAPEEPDEEAYWEIEDYKATVKLTPYDDDGEPSGQPITIPKEEYAQVQTEKKGYDPKTRGLNFLNLDDYIFEMLQDNSSQWDTRPDREAPEEDF